VLLRVVSCENIQEFLPGYARSSNSTAPDFEEKLSLATLYRHFQPVTARRFRLKFDDCPRLSAGNRGGLVKRQGTNSCDERAHKNFSSD
jgi:hypothetical protein